jgi:signal transduction histidine kinase
VSFKEFNIAKSLASVITSLQPLADKKQLLLSLDISPDINGVESDRRRVEQIFLNLINNAIKFTEHGSVSVAARIAGDFILTTITDTGIGIHEDNLEHIFEPFRQVDSGLSRLHEGTGLGLSICKALLTKLNGTINIQSALGAGTTVIVKIPIKHGA